MISRRHFVRSLTAGAALCASGCFGSFRATNWVLDLNRSLSSSKFVRWLIFLILVVIPVYEVAVLIDVWVLNSLEFWFGGPSAAEADADERVVQLDDGVELHLRKDRQAGVLYSTLVRRDAAPVELVFEMRSDGARVRKGDRVLATVRDTAGGGVELWAGGSTEQVDPETVRVLEERYETDGAAGAAAWAAASQHSIETVA